MTLMNETQRPTTYVAADRAAELTSHTEAATVDDHVCRRLADCPYAFFMKQVSWHFDEGVLTLEGRVRTERLKYALESLLGDVEHVEHIINRVDVVSLTGVSSSRPR